MSSAARVKCIRREVYLTHNCGGRPRIPGAQTRWGPSAASDMTPEHCRTLYIRLMAADPPIPPLRDTNASWKLNPLTSVNPNDLPRLHFRRPLTHGYEDYFSIQWIFGWCQETVTRIFKTLLKHNLVSHFSIQLEIIWSAQTRMRLITNSEVCSRTSVFHGTCLQWVKVQSSCKIKPEQKPFFPTLLQDCVTGSSRWEAATSRRTFCEAHSLKKELQSMCRGCNIPGP